MKKVILDTSFILSCIRNKIDFLEEISLMGIKIIIPQEVIGEIRGLKEKKTEADVALVLIEKNKDKFEKLELGKGHVDKKIINYAITQDKKENEIIVATLDKEIKDKLKQMNRKRMVIREKKRLEII
jgi:uncharacterized protein